VANTTTDRDGSAEKGPAMFDDSTWRAYAECRGENAVYFFAPSHFERKPEKDLREGMARSLCRRCKVQKQCLDYSIQVEEGHGIWGGLNELERKRLLRRRRAESA
jgi:WhiB family redox-sensing transcriptional regulator